jgi:hypothetical protein
MSIAVVSGRGSSLTTSGLSFFFFVTAHRPRTAS